METSRAHALALDFCARPPALIHLRPMLGLSLVLSLSLSLCLSLDLGLGLGAWGHESGAGAQAREIFISPIFNPGFHR